MSTIVPAAPTALSKCAQQIDRGDYVIMQRSQNDPMTALQGPTAAQGPLLNRRAPSNVLMKPNGTTNGSVVLHDDPVRSRFGRPEARSTLLPHATLPAFARNWAMIRPFQLSAQSCE